MKKHGTDRVFLAKPPGGPWVLAQVPPAQLPKSWKVAAFEPVVCADCGGPIELALLVQPKGRPRKRCGKCKPQRLGQDPSKRLGEASKRKFRDWVKAHKDQVLTTKVVAAGMPCSGVHARGLLDWATDRGILSRVGGSKPTQWRYAEAPAQKPRPKRKPPEVEAVERAVVGTNGHAAATGRRMKIRDKPTRELVDEAITLGCRLEKHGTHLRLLTPDGKAVFLSRTPSDSRSVPNARAYLRKQGVMVK